MSRLQSSPISTNGSIPTAQERYLHHKKQLHERLITGMDLSAIGAMKEDELRLEVRRVAEELSRQSADLLNLSERERLVNEVLDETFGLGPLEALMRDPSITDIMINGPGTAYVERRGRLERVHVAFNDERHLVQIMQRIAGRVGRRVDETSPMVDARLADGSRVNAIIPPLALDGPCSRSGVSGPGRCSHGPVGQQSVHAGDGQFPAGVHQGPGQHHHFWRDRQRQDNPAQRPFRDHPRRTSAW